MLKPVSVFFLTVCYLPNSGTSLFCTMYCLMGLLPSNPGVQLTFTALCPPSSVLQFSNKLTGKFVLTWWQQPFRLNIGGCERKFDNAQFGRPGVVSAWWPDRARVITHIGRSDRLDFQHAVLQNVDSLTSTWINQPWEKHFQFACQTHKVNTHCLSRNQSSW